MDKYKIVFESVAKYCESLKQYHEVILVKICSYVSLIDLIRVVSRLNRKFYIVSGNKTLLENYA